MVELPQEVMTVEYARQLILALVQEREQEVEVLLFHQRDPEYESSMISRRIS